MSELIPIPRGALFTVSAGEYSDYSDYTIHGVFRALQTIDIEPIREAWLKAHPEQRSRYSFQALQFLGHLVRLNLLEPVDCWELHLTNYSDIDEMHISKMESFTP